MEGAVPVGLNGSGDITTVEKHTIESDDFVKHPFRGPQLLDMSGPSYGLVPLVVAAFSACGELAGTIFGFPK